MSILRMIAVIGGVGVLFMCVLTAGVTFMPGTKTGHLFGASARALSGEGVDGAGPSAPLAPVAAAAAGSPDAGTGNWLFGTYHRPEGEERWALGLTAPFPRGYLGQLLSPLRALVLPVREATGAPPSAGGGRPQAADRA